MNFTVAIFALTIVTSCGGIVDQGSLNNAMLAGLKTYHTIRQVTVHHPQKVITTWHIGSDPTRCEWHMTADVVGDYAVDETSMFLQLPNCSEYTAQHWSGTFPCVFNRETLTTTCKGPLPAGAENGTWRLGYTTVDPVNRALPQKPSPSSKNVTSTPFKAKATLLSLASLGLARNIQRSAAYSGSGVITTSGYDKQWYLRFNSENALFELDTNLEVPEEEHRSLNVSWNAWLEGDRLIVDLFASWDKYQSNDDYDYADYIPEPDEHTDRQKRSLVLVTLKQISALVKRNDVTSKESSASTASYTTEVSGGVAIHVTDNPPFDNQTILTTRTIVSYSRNDIESSRITVDGKAYKINYVGILRTLALEPRLCPSITLASACDIMTTIASDERQQRKIGNVTAFYLRDLSRCTYKGQKFICTTGNAIGTKGLCVNVEYKSPAMNSDNPAWMELPIESLSNCAGRVYNFSDCESTQQLTHLIGPPRKSKRGTVHKF